MSGRDSARDTVPLDTPASEATSDNDGERPAGGAGVAGLRDEVMVDPVRDASHDSRLRACKRVHDRTGKPAFDIAVNPALLLMQALA
jgi:hypothetical protein